MLYCYCDWSGAVLLGHVPASSVSKEQLDHGQVVIGGGEVEGRRAGRTDCRSSLARAVEASRQPARRLGVSIRVERSNMVTGLTWER